MHSSRDLTGRTLGDFTIHDRIGEGGYGVVYRATQRTLGREAVVKVLHTRHGAGDAVVQRFLREAQLASRLDHPFAAHIYAFGAEPDGLLWIAMELVRGTTLRRVLEAQPGGRLPLARLIPLLDGLCEVVHTAHEQGIVHRDLKPDNIMVLSRAGRLLPKLLDLGIAKLVAAEPDDPAGSVLGTPHYMAPEQWREDAQVDTRADLYALGVIAYEMATGVLPFPGGSLADVARGHLRGEPPALPQNSGPNSFQTMLTSIFPNPTPPPDFLTEVLDRCAFSVTIAPLVSSQQRNHCAASRRQLGLCELAE